MDKKTKIIIVSAVCFCTLALCTTVAFVVGSRSGSDALVAQTTAPSIDDSSEFTTIESAGYARAGAPVYKRPDTGSEILATVESEEELLLLLAESPQWYRCMRGETVGFIQKSDMKSVGLSLDGLELPGGISLDAVEGFFGGGINIGDLDEGESGYAGTMPTMPRYTTTTKAPPSTLVPDTKETTIDTSAAARNMVLGVNDARASRGLSALGMSDAINADAQQHANYMASKDQGIAYSGNGEYYFSVGRMNSGGGAYQTGKDIVLANITGFNSGEVTQIGVGIAESLSGVHFCILIK